MSPLTLSHRPMADSAPLVYTVTQLTEEIGQVFNESFGSLSVEGEISGWKVAGSGHAYFSLKDEKSLLKAVMWRSRLDRLTSLPADGQLVRAHGKLTVYGPRGEYQLDVTTLSQAGVGVLLQRFENLKAQLAAEGLFDSDRKKAPPFHLKRVIVITSPTGAAIQDFLRVLRSRETPVEVLILPVRVQGVEAPAEIARAIRRAPGLGGDLLVLTRGGGSLEDLWAFNEEVVARAIAECPLPTVSGVGHDTDFTISDFVSDLRVPTPTAAAHLVTQLVEGLHDNVAEKGDRLTDAMSDRLSASRVDLELLSGRLRSASPLSAIPHHRRRIDDLIERGARALRGRTLERRRDLRDVLEQLRTRLERRILKERSEVRVRREKILAFNPQSTLERGYARIETARSHRAIRQTSEVPIDEDIRVQLADGSFEATPKV